MGRTYLPDATMGSSLPGIHCKGVSTVARIKALVVFETRETWHCITMHCVSLLYRSVVVFISLVITVMYSWASKPEQYANNMLRNTLDTIQNIGT